MPRALKPRQVGTFEHEDLLIRAPIFLDRNTLVFFVEYAGERVEAPSVREVEPLAKALVERKHDMKWAPVIQVETELAYLYATETHSRITLEFDRFEVAETTDAHGDVQHYKRCWLDEEPDERQLKSRESFRDITRDYDHQKTDGCYRVPYTEAAWEGLRRIGAVIRRAREELDALLRRADAGKLLAGAGSPGSTFPGLPAPRRKRAERGKRGRAK